MICWPYDEIWIIFTFICIDRYLCIVSKDNILILKCVFKRATSELIWILEIIFASGMVYETACAAA